MAAEAAEVKDFQMLKAEAAVVTALAGVIGAISVVLAAEAAAVPTTEVVLMDKRVETVDPGVKMVRMVVLTVDIRVDPLLLKVVEV